MEFLPTKSFLPAVMLQAQAAVRKGFEACKRSRFTEERTPESVTGTSDEYVMFSCAEVSRLVINNTECMYTCIPR